MGICTIDIKCNRNSNVSMNVT